MGVISSGIAAGAPAMPIETYIFCAGVVALFAAFMATLAWGVWYTRGVTPRW